VFTMNIQDIKLTAEAKNELRAIVNEEIDHPMTDDEVEDMGMRLLRFFFILETPGPETAGIQPNEQEQKALGFINSELKQGRSPTVRGIAKASGFRSSRTGHRLLKSLIAKGWVGRKW